MILREDIYVDEEQARKDFKEYQKQQIAQDKVQRQQAIESKLKPDMLPPCFDCIPLMHGYCRKTGTECKQFSQWKRWGKFVWPKTEVEKPWKEL